MAYNQQQQLYFKAFLPRSPWESFKALLRGSRATRARRNNDKLALAGIGAAENSFWGALPGGREYLFTAAAPGESITKWLREKLPAGCAQYRPARRELLRSLGVFIGRLHATGFIHGDLRPGNVLADLQHGRFNFTLLDNERTVKRNPPSGKRLLRNLMQLNVLPPGALSRTDRMRFFNSWHRQMRELSATEAKILGAEAYQWAVRRLENSARR